MSHRVGLDQATVVEAAAKLVDQEGLEQLSLGRLAALAILESVGKGKRDPG